MDRKERLRRHVHDESMVINTLNFLNEDRPTKVDEEAGPFLQVFPKSRILVHGYGSAGKAGFALKLLLTPPVEQGHALARSRPLKFEDPKYRRHVLVISFLYPRQYYEELVYDKLKLQRTVRWKFPGLDDPFIDFIIFYPGYITPEDFINKILRRLDQAILDGQPFNGVLLDGLHNVFLQFPRLQDYDMVWPLFYSILERYGLTSVSTFTNFALNDQVVDDEESKRNKMLGQLGPDYIMMQKGMTPFLHTMIKAADFYFLLEPVVFINGERKYLLSVKSAIGQDVPTEMLEWDRRQNVFRRRLTYAQYRARIGEVTTSGNLETTLSKAVTLKTRRSKRHSSRNKD